MWTAGLFKYLFFRSLTVSLYGNDASYWKGIFSELRKVGYDGTISIEHEDSLMNRMEGLQHAVNMVKSCAFFGQTSGMWWA